MLLMKKIFLFPGAVFIGKKPQIVDTVLGSCIAVAIFDSVLKFGSINHYMLPVWNGEGTSSNKYGDIAIPYLINKMIDMGSNRADLKAKVFGGSEINQPNGFFQIGARNAAIAFEILKREKIPVVSQSVGGNQSRKIIFYSDSGAVLVRFVQSVKVAELSIVKPKS